MTEVPGPFAVAAEQVERLGASFATFINQLLDVETATAGMSGVDLAYTYRETLADGGVDAGLRHGTATRWIPKGESAWQFKAGDRAPAKCACELEGASEALDVLRKGGKYRLVLGAALTPQKLNNRRKALRDKALELGITISDDSIEVLDANSIARWAQDHPALAVSRLLGGIDTVAVSFSQWSASNRTATIWVASESRDQLTEQIQSFIGGDRHLDLHIEGVSGLGKTRAVLEALRASKYEPLVLYIPAADYLSPQLLPRLVAQGRAGIVVVDDCGAKRHEALAGLIPAGSVLRLITIGEPDGRQTESPPIRLGPMDNAVIEEILTKNRPTLPPEARRVVVEVAAGNVRWGLVLADAVLEKRRTSASQLITAETIRSFVTDRLPGGDHFLAASALALFTRVGYEGELSSELAVLGSLVGIDVAQLRAASRAMQEAGLLTSQGRYRSVGPYPLAVYLAAIGWAEFGESIIMKLSSLPPSLAERLLQRAADIGDSDRARGAVERILSDDGPFSSLSKIEESSSSRLLIQVAIIAPEKTAEHLARLIRDASMDELRSRSGVRRDLVWALEKLVWHSHLFRLAADALLRLALAENETYANNASGTWVDLFGAMLPGTAARPAERIAYLEEVSRSAEPAVRQLAASACKRALAIQESIAASGELQGGVVVEARGGPTTWGELWNYQRVAVRTLRRLFDDADTAVGEAALDALIECIHPYLDYDPVRDELFEALSTLSPSALRRVRTEISHLTELFSRLDGVDPEQAGLHLLISRLPQPTHSEQLRVLAHSSRWDFVDGQLQHRITELVGHLTTDDARHQLLAILGEEDDLPAAFELGYALFGVDNAMSTLDQLIDLAARSSDSAIVGYLWAAVDAGDSQAFDTFLDGPGGQRLSPTTRLAITVRGPKSNRGWDRIAELNESLAVAVVAPRLFQWHVDIDSGMWSRLLARWLERLNTQLDYNAVVNLMAMALYNNSDWIEHLDDLVADLVGRRREFPQTGPQSYDWVRLAKRQLSRQPATLLITILDLIDSDAMHPFRDNPEAEALTAAIAATGSAALDPVMGRVAARSWRLQIRTRGWLLSTLRPELIIGWIGDDLDRARLVARVAGIGDAEPDGVIRYLLDTFGQDEQVSSSLAAEFISGSWTGNESARIARQITQLEAWVGSDSEPDGVKRWAREMVKGLESTRRAALQREAEEEG